MKRVQFLHNAVIVCLESEVYWNIWQNMQWLNCSTVIDICTLHFSWKRFWKTFSVIRILLWPKHHHNPARCYLESKLQNSECRHTCCSEATICAKRSQIIDSWVTVTRKFWYISIGRKCAYTWCCRTSKFQGPWMQNYICWTYVYSS